MLVSSVISEDANSAAAVRFSRTALGLTKSLVQHGLLGLLLFVVIINQRGMRKPEGIQRNVTDGSVRRQKWFQSPALSLTSGCWPRAAAAPWSPAGWWRTAGARRRRLPTGPSIPVGNNRFSSSRPLGKQTSTQQSIIKIKSYWLFGSPPAWRLWWSRWWKWWKLRAKNDKQPQSDVCKQKDNKKQLKKHRSAQPET